MTVQAFRYALYLVPEQDSLLWQVGSAALGYDAITGESVPQPVFAGLDPRALVRLTDEPRRYGFHMTIKAPFRLAKGFEPEALVEAARSMARAHQAVTPGPLQVKFRRMRGENEGFLCLEPREIPDALATLERDVVIGLDRFRAPLTPDDIARRSPDRLTLRQRALLDRFGYPFVLDEFRPHFSLTGRTTVNDDLLGALENVLVPVLRGPRIRYRLALFTQNEAGAPFRGVPIV